MLYRCCKFGPFNQTKALKCDCDGRLQGVDLVSISWDILWLAFALPWGKFLHAVTCGGAHEESTSLSEPAGITL